MEEWSEKIVPLFSIHNKINKQVNMETRIFKVKDKDIEFEVIPNIEIKEDELICDRCSYYGVCENIPDPRELEGRSFLDYCIEMDEDLFEVEGFVKQHIPVPGSLDKLDTIKI